MASFSVTWNKNGRNLEELQSWRSHTQPSIPGISCRKNSLSYKSRNRAQKFVVNNFSGISPANSAARSNDYWSSYSSSSSSALFDQAGDKIFSTRTRTVDKEEDVSRKLDQWVKDSVVEIVNYLGEAPFLVHIYSDGDGEEGSKSISKKKNKLVKEKTAAESWPSIKERWVNGGSPTPNGIILVEEMKCSEEGGDLDEENLGKKRISSSTKTWGIVIQGKGANYPACYMLKTTRVSCVSGSCTHFCLFRVECFLEHLDIQFKKLWLL